jgi:hypothetical protein
MTASSAADNRVGGFTEVVTGVTDGESTGVAAVATATDAGSDLDMVCSFQSKG